MVMRITSGDIGGRISGDIGGMVSCSDSAGGAPAPGPTSANIGGMAPILALPLPLPFPLHFAFALPLLFALAGATVRPLRAPAKAGHARVHRAYLPAGASPSHALVFRKSSQMA